NVPEMIRIPAFSVCYNLPDIFNVERLLNYPSHTTETSTDAYGVRRMLHRSMQFGTSSDIRYNNSLREIHAMTLSINEVVATCYVSEQGLPCAFVGSIIKFEEKCFNFFDEQPFKE